MRTSGASVAARPSDHLDDVVLGAGLSGIGAAVHPQTALLDAGDRRRAAAARRA